MNMESSKIQKTITFFYYMTNLLIILKIYNTITKGKCRSITRLDGKVIIVTGSNTGIGKAAALNFAKRGARVILACRDLIKANDAKDEIVTISGNENVVVRHLDLRSLDSVRDFAEMIISTENRLDVLVNNAGVAGAANKKSKDGIELGYQVNHYGHFLLTNLLIDLLKKSAPSRIIHVSSVLHKIMGELDFDNMKGEKTIKSSTKVYSNSKLYNVIGSNEFARRLEGTGVTSNSLHPGAVRTEVFRHVPTAVKYIVDKTFEIFFKTVEEGAQTTIHLAVTEDVAKVSGKYFSDCKEASPASITQDREIGKKFWGKCCDIVGLKPEERFI